MTDSQNSPRNPDSLDLPAPQPVYQPFPTRDLTREEAEELYRHWLSGKSEDTVRGYAEDFLIFARSIGRPDPIEAIRYLLSLPLGKANSVVLGFRTEQEEAGLAPATVNRRLAAVRSMAEMGALLGLTHGKLAVKSVRQARVRHVQGPTPEQVQQLHLAALNRPVCDGIKARDVAIVACMAHLGLRRVECWRASIDDLDLSARTLAITGKGQREPEVLGLPDETASILANWAEARALDALDDGLFTSYSRDTRYRGRKLAKKAYHRVLTSVFDAAGLEFTGVHSLRRAAINAAAETSGYNAAVVQAFSRHARFDQTKAYLDRLGQLRGEVARDVAKKMVP